MRSGHCCGLVCRSLRCAGTRPSAGALSNAAPVLASPPQGRTKPINPATVIGYLADAANSGGGWGCGGWGCLCVCVGGGGGGMGQKGRGACTDPPPPAPPPPPPPPPPPRPGRKSRAACTDVPREAGRQRALVTPACICPFLTPLDVSDNPHPSPPHQVCRWTGSERWARRRWRATPQTQSTRVGAA